VKYVIIGAVAGGASTAARLRRLDEHADIVIFEKGSYISYANCGLPYYIGDVIKERDKLFVQTATAFNKRFNIDVRVKCEVTSIDRARKKVIATDLVSGRQVEESYDKLVLSPGAEPVRPPIPGIGLNGIFTLRNVTDTDHIKSHANERRSGNAVIVGAGFIGLEMAENLHQLGMDVTIVEMADQILAPVDYPIAATAQQYLRTKGVKLKLKAGVAAFEEQGNGVNVIFSGGGAIYADMVILSIGVRPDTRLAVSAGLRIGEAGGIFVNEYLQTSDPDIYAVGDVIEFRDPITGRSRNTYLAGPANKQGRICANNIVQGNVEAYQGSINTAILKLFDMTLGATGLASKHLTAAGIAHMVSTVTNGHHAGYYPDPMPIIIQVTFSPDGGKLLGAQVAGYEGADKRLDVLASVVKAGGTIFDLAEFEHAYAPPYSSAKDPVNMAGFVAENILQKKLRVIYWNDVQHITADDVLIDVRNEEEYLSGSLAGAVNIPLDQLRARLSEIPKAKKVYIFCQIGLRGYLAQRILLQTGFEQVANISGGYGLYNTCVSEQNLLSEKENILN
jgi:NADPH-dependent 2,4-dienoyl-CoA reductase/sulfur reductase-like enzyme/rhodanese-related sulfurtransferase